jgi:hypothetical protein
VTAEVTARRFGLASPAAAAALAVLAVLLAGVSVPLHVVTHQNVLANSVENIALAVVFGSVGLVVAGRQPRNPIGWLLLAGPVLELLFIDGALYGALAYRPGHHLPLGAVAVLLAYSWFPGLGALALVILLFPDGAPPSPRWRWVLWSYLAVAACYAAVVYTVVMSAPGHDARIDSSGVLTPDPAGWFAIVTKLSGPVSAAFWLSFVAAQVLSWRRSSGERRQQLKWLMSGAAVLAVCEVIAQVSVVTAVNPWATPVIPDLVAAVGLAALPLSIGVGILKYRLYDIDRIISRTLGYGIVTGLLVGVYAGVVLLATRVLPISSPVAVAGATLAAAALFNPLRHRVQRVVDRRFNRVRYDADRTVAAFAARLQDAVDLDSVRDDLAGVVQKALEPVHLSVWMSEHR